MNDLIADATGLPLKFPDYRETIRAEAEAFRRLSRQERSRHLNDVLQAGHHLDCISPNRGANDRLNLERENEWRRIQRELFERERARGRGHFDMD
jgi:hypothetical protein